MKLFLEILVRLVRNKFNGYATKIGAASGVLVGVAGLLGYVFEIPDYPLKMDLDTSLGFIAGGITAFGAARKAEKITKVLEGKDCGPVQQ